MASTSTTQLLALPGQHEPIHKITFHSFRSVGNEQMILTRNHESLMGPSNDKDRKIFYVCVTTLILSGAANDFLGKTIYQILPGVDSGWQGLVHDHWATLCLAICAFSASSMAIITGRKSFKKMNRTIFLHLLLPSFMDFFVTASRYLALVFLPAAMVTILKSGGQLIFLSIVRRFRGKILGIHQWVGIFVIAIGLGVVALHTLFTNIFFDDCLYTVSDTLYGLLIMFFVGIAGAIRNTAEEILLKNHKLDAYFLVGMESLISLISALIFGGILLVFEPSITFSEAFSHIFNTFKHYPSILICVLFFMTVVYLKDTMQMKVTLMSSAMTRKLFQQLYPIFTFLFSLTLYLSTKQFGEKWDRFSYLEIIGFIVVLYGAYLYFLEPKYGLPDRVLTCLGISNGRDRSPTDLFDQKNVPLTSEYLMHNGGIDTATATNSVETSVILNNDSYDRDNELERNMAHV